MYAYVMILDSVPEVFRNFTHSSFFWVLHNEMYCYRSDGENPDNRERKAHKKKKLKRSKYV